MNLANITVDDFHPAPLAIAAVARSLDYSPQEWRGRTYKGIGLGYSPEGAYNYLSEIMGAQVKPSMEFFRLGTKEESYTTLIHADSACAKFAAVWYLSEAPEGVQAGTAFWKHKETGLTHLPSDLVAHVGSQEAVKPWLEKMDADGNDETKWHMIGLTGQKFNRITIYPTSVFHSRFPKDAWGNGVSDGRIVWTSFFNI